MYKETVSEQMWTLLQGLMKDEHLNDFVLVGGTALSLKMGHRQSVDIDLFTTKDFDSSRISEHLQANYGAVIHRRLNNGVLSHIDGIKVDISGKRLKDFVDMFFLLEKNPLKIYLDAYEKKYQSNSKMAGYALLYFENINWAQKIHIREGKETDWNKMKFRLEKALFEPTRQFGIHPEQTLSPAPRQRPRPVKKRGRGLR